MSSPPQASLSQPRAVCLSLSQEFSCLPARITPNPRSNSCHSGLPQPVYADHTYSKRHSHLGEHMGPHTGPQGLRPSFSSRLETARPSCSVSPTPTPARFSAIEGIHQAQDGMYKRTGLADCQGLRAASSAGRLLERVNLQL